MITLKSNSKRWFQENLIEFSLNCAQDFILYYMVCASLSHGYSNNSSSDPINHLTPFSQTIEKLNYNLRYGSAGPLSKSNSESNSSNATLTILGGVSLSKYIL